MYDRAQEQFHRLEAKEQEAFLNNVLFKRYPQIAFDNNNNEDKRRKVFWMVTSTSWTPDENFDLLLSALCLFDKLAWERQGGRALPFTLALIITGKGPLRMAYMEKIATISKGWKNNIIVRDVWLALEDYPKLLGSCHLGISLHQSSSGWDLPMKVVDMFGCGLTCCAINFPW